MNRRRLFPALIACLGAVPMAAPAYARESLIDRLLRVPATGASNEATPTLAAGLKEALRIGTERSVSRVQVVGGFFDDPSIRIPLPRALKKARKVLGRVGLGGTLDELELQMNRAAETAAPRAKQLFVDAVSSMTFDDARGILQGPDNAATQFLRTRSELPLTSAMRPVIDDTLSRVGAVTTMQSLLTSMQGLPLAQIADLDLTGFVVGKAMDGLFHYIALEEAAIRKDPVKRTTALLRQVFG